MDSTFLEQIQQALTSTGKTGQVSILDSENGPVTLVVLDNDETASSNIDQDIDATTSSNLDQNVPATRAEVYDNARAENTTTGHDACSRVKGTTVAKDTEASSTSTVMYFSEAETVCSEVAREAEVPYEVVELVDVLLDGYDLASNYTMSTVDSGIIEVQPQVELPLQMDPKKASSQSLVAPASGVEEQDTPRQQTSTITSSPHQSIAEGNSEFVDPNGYTVLKENAATGTGQQGTDVYTESLEVVREDPVTWQLYSDGTLVTPDKNNSQQTSINIRELGINPANLKDTEHIEITVVQQDGKQMNAMINAGEIRRGMCESKQTVTASPCKVPLNDRKDATVPALPVVSDVQVKANIAKLNDAHVSRDSTVKDQDNVDKINEAKETYKCEFCDKMFGSMTTYKKHVAQLHKPDGKEIKKESRLPMYTCVTCGKTCTSEKSLKAHEKVHASQKRCLYCSSSASSSSKLVDHIANKHAEVSKTWNLSAVSQPCSRCERVFNSEIEVKEHINIYHGRPFVCLFCDVNDVDENVIKEHLSAAHSDVAVLSWNTKEGVLSDEGEELESGDELTLCDICGSPCNDGGELRSHMTTEHFDGDVNRLLTEYPGLDKATHKIRCLKCRKILKTREAVKLHMKYLHYSGNEDCMYGEYPEMRDIPDSVPFMCEFCGDVYISNRSLMKHMATHGVDLPLEVKSIEIKYCIMPPKNSSEASSDVARSKDDDKTESADDIAANVMKTEKEIRRKPFKCDYCERTFKRANTWRNHTHRCFMSKKVKEQLMPFECTVCKRRFETNGSLKRHKIYCKQGHLKLNKNLKRKTYDIMKSFGKMGMDAKVQRESGDLERGRSRKSIEFSKLEKMDAHQETNESSKSGKTLFFEKMQLKATEQLQQNSKQQGGNQRTESTELIKRDEMHIGSVDGAMKNEQSNKEDKTSSSKKTVTVNLLVCKFCGKLFSDASALSDHIIIHVDEAPSSSDDDTHVDDSPSSLFTYKCDHCSYVYSTTQGIMQHTKIKHPMLTESVVIDIIEVDTPKSSLTRGSASKSRSAEGQQVTYLSDDGENSTDNGFACEEDTDFKFSEVIETRAVNLQEENSSTTTANTDDEDDRLPDVMTVNRDQVSYMGRSRYACRFCLSFYKTFKGVENHERLRHFGMLQFGQLSLPSSILVGSGGAMKRRRYANSFTCSVCSRIFLTEDQLKSHIRVMHPSKVSKNSKGLYMNSCRICELSDFKDKSAYDEHVKMHINGKYRFKCPHCTKTSKKEYLLRAHVFLTHSKPKDFFCRICSVTFDDGKALRGHMDKTHDIEVIKVESALCDQVQGGKQIEENDIAADFTSPESKDSVYERAEEMSSNDNVGSRQNVFIEAAVCTTAEIGSDLGHSYNTRKNDRPLKVFSCVCCDHNEPNGSKVMHTEHSYSHTLTNEDNGKCISQQATQNNNKQSPLNRSKETPVARAEGDKATIKPTNKHKRTSVCKDKETSINRRNENDEIGDKQLCVKRKGILVRKGSELTLHSENESQVRPVGEVLVKRKMEVMYKDKGAHVNKRMETSKRKNKQRPMKSNNATQRGKKLKKLVDKGYGLPLSQGKQRPVKRKKRTSVCEDMERSVHKKDAQMMKEEQQSVNDSMKTQVNKGREKHFNNRNNVKGRNLETPVNRSANTNAGTENKSGQYNREYSTLSYNRRIPVDKDNKVKLNNHDCSLVLKNLDGNNVTKTTTSSKFTCTTCSRDFPSEKSLQGHNFAVHRSVTIPVMSCDICQKTFTTKYSLLEHMLDHTSVKTLLCKICNAPFNSVQEVDDHQAEHFKTGAKDIDKSRDPDGSSLKKCRRCDVLLPGEALEAHMSQFHSRLAAEKNVFVKSKEIKLKLKQRKLQRKLFLAKKRQGEHELPVKKRKVNTGKMKPESKPVKKATARHVATPYSKWCHPCSKKFVTKSNYAVHMKRFHGDNLRIEHSKVCPICSKTFTRRRSMLRHCETAHNVKINTDMKNFGDEYTVTSQVCGKCCQTFPSIEQCRHHMNQCSGNGTPTTPPEESLNNMEEVKVEYLDSDSDLGAAETRTDLLAGGIQWIKCESCCRAYSSRASFMDHLRKYHSIGACITENPEVVISTPADIKSHDCHSELNDNFRVHSCYMDLNTTGNADISKLGAVPMVLLKRIGEGSPAETDVYDTFEKATDGLDDASIGSGDSEEFTVSIDEDFDEPVVDTSESDQLCEIVKIEVPDLSY